MDEGGQMVQIFMYTINRSVDSKSSYYKGENNFFNYIRWLISAKLMLVIISQSMSSQYAAHLKLTQYCISLTQ